MRVPLRVSVRDLGPPRRELWQAAKPFTPFKADASHPWPLAVQEAFWRYRRDAAASHLRFTHDYERAYRHRNRFTWHKAAWKNPVIDAGAAVGAEQTRLKAEFEAIRDRVWGVLTVKEAADFGGVATGRQVA